MLISALCAYYDVLARKGEVNPEGYSKVNIHYLVCLKPNGEISNIVDHQIMELVSVGKGKTREKKMPRCHLMPKRTEKPGIDANIAEHRPLYLFGLNWNKDCFTTRDKTDKAKKSHQVFVEKQLGFLEGLESELVNAYRNFVQNWMPENETENPHLLALGKSYTMAGYAFCLEGVPELLLHEDPVFQAAWQREWKVRALESHDADRYQCCITGRTDTIALTHNKIQGFPGGSATGNSIVSFNSPSVESYGKIQSQNSNISRIAMLKYTEAMNSLVSDRKKWTKLHDMTVLHWAISESDLYDQLVDTCLFSDFVEDGDGMDADDAQKALESIWAKAQNAVLRNENLAFADNIDPSVSFYIAGLKPNSTRLALTFIYHNQFGCVLKNIVQHQLDMSMFEIAKPISLRRIERELQNPNSSESQKKIDPSLISRLFGCIIMGHPYPAGLLATIIRRVKCDSDNENNKYIKINPTRVGIIKGYLNRKARLSGRKEEIQMALNTDNTNPAYLCGRLFAVLEKLQTEASGGTLNRTIKDAYFSSACSTPAVVFPKLIKLAQHHISNASNGGYWNYMIGQIMADMNNSFPKSLPLEDQGRFILGYYQQFYTKQKNKNVEEE